MYPSHPADLCLVRRLVSVFLPLNTNPRVHDSEYFSECTWCIRFCSDVSPISDLWGEGSDSVMHWHSGTCVCPGAIARAVRGPVHGPESHSGGEAEAEMGLGWIPGHLLFDLWFFEGWKGSLLWLPIKKSSKQIQAEFQLMTRTLCSILLVHSPGCHIWLEEEKLLCLSRGPNMLLWTQRPLHWQRPLQGCCGQMLPELHG